jgi:hypothetical protein
VSPAKPPGWERTQQGWTDQPCNQTLPHSIAGHNLTCDKVIPTIGGNQRSHQDHQWQRRIGAHLVTVTWRTL